MELLEWILTVEFELATLCLRPNQHSVEARTHDGIKLSTGEEIHIFVILTSLLHDMMIMTT